MELSPVHTKINSELEHGNNWNDGYILYSELKNLQKESTSSAIATYCF
jgi:hypothetical protein